MGLIDTVAFIAHLYTVCIPHRHRCLARLGETHRSKCHPQRETSLVLGKTTNKLVIKNHYTYPHAYS